MLVVSSVRRPRRRLVLVAVSVGLLVGLFGGAGAAAADVGYFPVLTGAEEVPGPGDPDGDGLAQIDITPADGSVCATWDILGIDPATAAHIHAGAAGVSGAVVVTLPTPAADGTGGDCVSGLDEATLQAIVDDPDAYYVNVHNDAFPDGAIRGQLGGAIEFLQLGISFLACPAGFVIEPIFEGLPEGCRPVLRADDVPPLPTGYSFDTEPLTAAVDVEIDDGAEPLTVADASWEGGSSCNTATFLCSIGGSFVWVPVFSGDTVITQLVAPNGYQLAGATVSTGPSDSEVVGLSGPSEVTIDTTGVDNLFITLYDLAGGAPGPTTAITVPPTSTIAAGAGGSSSAVLAALGVIIVILLAALGAVVVPHRQRAR
jgi:hypothetical protein